MVDVKVVKSKKDYIEARIIALKKIDKKWLDIESLKCQHYFFQPNLDNGVQNSGCKIGC